MSGAGKITVISGAIKPRRANKHDAGLDVAIQDTVTIHPNETKYMPAGVKLSLEIGYRADVMTRSSTASKFQLSVIPTVVDCHYTGEISTIVSNFTDKPITVEKGTYLAQVIVSKTYEFDNELESGVKTSDSSRSPDDKFGSSDK